MTNVKKNGAKEVALPAPAEYRPSGIIGEAVGRMSAVLVDALPLLGEAEGKRLLRQLAAIVKAETEALEK